MKKILLTLAIFSNLILANELNFDTLQSDFTQTVTSKNQSINYSGHFTAKQNLGAFWHYKEPIEKFIYFNRNSVSIIEPDLEQVTITSLKDSPNINEILSKAKKISKKEFETNFNDIIYKIYVKDNLPVKISYIDNLDNKVEIKLSKTYKDEPINIGLLSPKIPENYDILRN